MDYLSFADKYRFQKVLELLKSTCISFSTPSPFTKIMPSTTEVPPLHQSIQGEIEIAEHRIFPAPWAISNWYCVIPPCWRMYVADDDLLSDAYYVTDAELELLVNKLNKTKSSNHKNLMTQPGLPL